MKREVVRHKGVPTYAVGLLAVGLAGAASHALAEGFPAVFELSSLAAGDGSTGFVLNGIDVRDWSGSFVSVAGDVNGDGTDDLIIAARGADPGGRSYAGESYVVFGQDTSFPAVFELSSLAEGDGSTGFVLNGSGANNLSPNSLSPAGDVNGDGVDDFIIGAGLADPGGRSGAGESYVVFGRDTGFPSEFELSSLAVGDGSSGFVLNGIDPGDRSGWSVSTAGDVNGDGLDDLIVGAPYADPPARSSAGETYVVFGRDTGFPAEIELSSLAAGDGSSGFALNGKGTFDRSGWSVSTAGDVNGDGVDDLIIGAFRADPGGLYNAGESYVVLGRDTGFPAEIELSILATGDGSTGFVLNGIDTQDEAGLSVSAAGDVNGDGAGDIIIGARDADPGGRLNAGESYIVFGQDIGFAAEFELSSLANGDGSTGFVMNGIDAEDLSSAQVSAAGDVNGDGVDDLIVGAVYADAGGQSNAGESYVVFGRHVAFPAEFELSSLAAGDGSAGFVLNGVDALDQSGVSVSAAGDVNGDGVDDLIVGALFADPGGRYNAGESYVVYGRAPDTDGDGVSDTADNCSAVANADQRDTDGDGHGNRCDADLNQDCAVSAQDLGLFKSVFFTVNADADFDGNGIVNVIDLGILKSRFFQPVGPSAAPNLCDDFAPRGRERRP